MPPHKLTQEQFVKKSQSIHGYKYDYSKTVYKGSFEKIIIICREHGEFIIEANSHIRKHGCRKCGMKKRPVKIPFTTKEFIDIASKKHGNKYSYDKTIYTGVKNKVIITCPVHGDFKITGNKHIHCMAGCQKCHLSSGESTAISIFEEKCIKYESQVTFSDCRYKKPLHFDFKVFRNDKDFFLIEIDGEQHRRITKFKGQSLESAIKEHAINLERDRVKNEWALKNGICLYRVNYNGGRIKKLTEDLSNIISKEF